MSGYLISIGSHKGGVGKSTFVTNLAVDLSLMHGKTVYLIDTDSQKSLTHWSKDLRDNNEKISNKIPSQFIQDINEKNFVKVLLELKKHYDYIIIDTPGRKSLAYLYSINLADLLISPVYESYPDLKTVENVVDSIALARSNNSKLKAYFFINKSGTHANNKRAKESKDFLNEFKDIKTFDTVLGNRVDYRDAFAEGKSVVEYKPKSEAAKEIKKIVNEIIKIRNKK